MMLRLVALPVILAVAVGTAVVVVAELITTWASSRRKDRDE